MIRYVIDGRSLQDGSAVRGIGTYLRGLLAGLESLGVSKDVSLMLERGSPLPPTLVSAGFTTHPSRLLPVNRHLRALLDPLQVSRALRAQPPELYHAVEYAQPLLPRIPVVVTVHDLIPFVMPRLYPWLHRERALAMRQLRHADAVIAVSHSTADDLERIAGVDRSRITVIGEGVTLPSRMSDAQLTKVKQRLHLPDRFVLAVGTFDPRKRIGALTSVVRRLRADHDVALVIAGFQGSFAAAVQRSVRDARIDTVTRVVGHVTDEDLVALYQLAECLIFTSAYEGFGLPPLEAMAAGTPVAVFDNSSLAEVVGDAALLVEDGRIPAMADAVSSLLGDPQERQRRAVMGRARAARFTWDRAAQATLSVYSEVLASS